MLMRPVLFFVVLQSHWGLQRSFYENVSIEAGFYMSAAVPNAQQTVQLSKVNNACHTESFVYNIPRAIVV